MLRPVLPFGVLKRKPPVLRASPICVLFDDGASGLINCWMRGSIERPLSPNRLIVCRWPLSVRR